MEAMKLLNHMCACYLEIKKIIFDASCVIECELSGLTGSLGLWLIHVYAKVFSDDDGSTDTSIHSLMWYPFTERHLIFSITFVALEW